MKHILNKGNLLAKLVSFDYYETYSQIWLNTKYTNEFLFKHFSSQSPLFSFLHLSFNSNSFSKFFKRVKNIRLSVCVNANCENFFWWVKCPTKIEYVQTLYRSNFKQDGAWLKCHDIMICNLPFTIYIHTAKMMISSMLNGQSCDWLV